MSMELAKGSLRKAPINLQRDPGCDLHALRLGFVSGRLSSMVDGEIRTDAGTGRLIDALAAGFEKVTVSLSASPTPISIHDHALAISPRDFVPLPYMPSYARGVHRLFACRRAISEVEAQSDVLVVQLPFQVPGALLFGRRPRVYHLCADVWSIASSSPSYRGPHRAAARAMAGLVHAVQRYLTHGKRARVVANGAALLQVYGGPRGRSVVSAAIRESEILSATRTRPADAPFRVLFVGYLRPEKGIDTLAEAFELFLRDNPRAELAIVGVEPIVDRGVNADLAHRLGALRAAGKVIFLGELGYGPSLFSAFADADVLVVPSRSEGTPRVLVEARAFGCPVIASNIGGIPSSVKHGVDGLLIPPGDPQALCRALGTLSQDSELRARLVRGGLDRVRSCTVESFASNVLDELGLLLADARAAS